MSVSFEQPAILVEPIAPVHGVSFAEEFKVWLRVAMLSFGDPARQIAVAIAAPLTIFSFKVGIIQTLLAGIVLQLAFGVVS